MFGSCRIWVRDACDGSGILKHVIVQVAQHTVHSSGSHTGWCSATVTSSFAVTAACRELLEGRQAGGPTCSNNRCAGKIHRKFNKVMKVILASNALGTAVRDSG